MNPTAHFVDAFRIPKDLLPLPKLVDVPFGAEPTSDKGLVSVRYIGHDAAGTKRQVTVRNNPESTGERWSQVTGGLHEAIRAARSLAIVDGYTEDVQKALFARTSVAVLDAGNGVWQLMRMQYPDGMGDGMDPIISMPLDRVVGGATSQVSIPFGAMSGGPDIEFADRIQVRFDDPRVKALVGVDSVALNPTR